MFPGDEFWLAILAALIALAVIVFLRIQSYLSDPRRRQFNEEWFDRFEENMHRRYRNRELLWRTHALDALFSDRGRRRSPGSEPPHGMVSP